MAYKFGSFDSSTPSSPIPSNQQIASTLGDEGNSTFWNVLRFLSRPGFAARSLLMGDVEGAVRNVGQMALDLPTGGFINRDLNLASIANVFLPEKYELPEELTTRAQRPEFTDVLDKWGVADKEKLGWGSRLALDVVGGMVTDPTTFLTMGSGGIAKGTLQTGAGMRHLADGSQEALVEALRQTKAGSSALDDAIVAAKAAHPPRPGALLPGPLGRGRTPEALEQLTGKALEKRAAEDVLLKFGGGASEIDDGLKALEQANLIQTKGALYGKIPFGPRTQSPLTSGGVWGKIGSYGTAPGWAMHGLRKISPVGAAGIEAASKQLLDGVKSTFFGRKYYGNTGLGKNAPFAREAAEKTTMRSAARGAQVFREGVEAFGDIAENEKLLKAIGELGTAAEDTFVNMSKFEEVIPSLRALNPQAASGVRLPLSQFKQWGVLDKFAKNVADGVPGADDALLEAKSLLDGLRRGTVKKATRELVRDYSGSFDFLNHTYVRNGRQFNNGGDTLGSLLDNLRAQERLLAGRGLSAHARKIQVQNRKDTMLLLREQSKNFFQFYGWEKGVRSLNTKGIRNLRNSQTADLLQQELGLSAAEAAAKSEKMWKIWDGARARQAQDLVSEGIWPHAEFVNPFRMPHQTTALFYKLLQDGFVDRGFYKKYFKGRTNPTTQSFRDTLVSIAKKNGVDIPADAVQETNIAKLFVQQAEAHTRAIAYQELKNELTKLGMKASPTKQQTDPLFQYLQHQFKALPERGVAKILGGGKYTVNVNSVKNPEAAAALKSWANAFDEKTSLFRRTIDEAGNVTLNFPGLNALYKPLLTVVHPAFHVRNNLGAAFMGLLDPDIGLKGVKQSWLALRNGKAVHTLSKAGWSGDEITNFVRYLSDDLGEHTAGAMALAKTNPKIGRYTWQEVGKILDSAGLGPSIRRKSRNMADLADELFAHTDVLGRQLNADWKGLREGLNPGAMAANYRAIVKLGYDAADLMERRFRANAIVEMLQKGASPSSAIKRMNKAFVNYNTNSVAERFVRDLIPFAKFAIHSTTWAKNIADNPSLVTWMARARGQVPEGEFLPERAEDSLALPMPWKTAEGNQAFLLGLGLPLEVTLNMLGVGTAKGFRRNVLAGINPLVRTPLEHSVNRSFYFGDEFGVFRKPPSYLPASWTNEITLPDGSKRYEIPGEINEIIRSMPVSRIESTVDKLFNTKRPAWDKALNLLTGARTMTVDQERELKLRLQDYLKDKARSGEVGETLIYFSRMDQAKMPEDLKIILSGLKGMRDKKRKERRGLAR